MNNAMTNNYALTPSEEVMPRRKYSTSEASEILGVDRSTIRHWADKGYLRYGVSRHNGRRFYTGAELLRFYNSKY